MLKLVSANIEGNRHLSERILPFLQAQKPDIVMLQEVFAKDVEQITAITGGQWQFMPVATVTQSNPHLPNRGEWGELLLLPQQVSAEFGTEYYYQVDPDSEQIPEFFAGGDPNHMDRGVIEAAVTLQNDQSGETIKTSLLTTHFTWSPAGSFTPEQARDYANLHHILKDRENWIIAGDFNSPRQGVPENVFNQLASQYQCWIPEDVTTTLDPELHKAGPLELTVDGLFSSGVDFGQVRVVAGVSDHQAIVAELPYSFA